MTIRSARAIKSVSALIGALVLAAVLSACGGTNYDASAKPTINDQEALTQVTRLFEDVLEKNKADLEKFLAPNFVQQRTTGVGITKDDYINGLPDLYSYKLVDVTGLQYGDTLTATYQASTNLIVDGKKYPKAPVPFLTTFVRTNGEWYLVANGNFGITKS
jgi:hypothetical protein